MITTRQCTSQEQVLQQAAIQLNTILYSFKGKPILFLSSGGSSLKILDHVNANNLTELVTVSLLDERFSTDQTVNNFSLLAAHPFYAAAQSAGATFLDTRSQPGDTLAVAAARWNDALHDWINTHSQGIVIATMGLGVDGHTAGIMPYPEAPAIFDGLFCQREPWVVGYQATGKNPYPDRMTTTIHFIQERITNAICVVSGADKKPALQAVMATDGNVANTPGRVMNTMKNVILFTDIA